MSYEETVTALLTAIEPVAANYKRDYPNATIHTTRL